jgi:hypothetical protein
MGVFSKVTPVFQESKWNTYWIPITRSRVKFTKPFNTRAKLPNPLYMAYGLLTQKKH